MADANLINNASRGPQSQIHAALLPVVAGTTDGVWTSVKLCYPLTVEVVITGTATAEVRVSNNVQKPDDDTYHGVMLGSQIAMDEADDPFVGGDSRVIDTPWYWVKVRVTAWTTGSVEAYVAGGMGDR